MKPFLDILGIGCVAVDDFIYVASYPGADAKIPVRKKDRQCGGLTATALVAAARLGSKCAYAGILGEDELSSFAVRCLEREEIDVSHLRREADARPIHSVIIVDETQQTRNIFYDLEGVKGPGADHPSEEVLRFARVLFVDHLNSEGMARAARIAREASIPVVADLESTEGPAFSELLALVTHLVVSWEFARKHTGENDPAGMVRKLWDREKSAVVVTRGAEGCWYRGAEDQGELFHQPAFRVEVADTTGCGDVFHGAYCSALVRGFSLPDRVRFAASAAALKATRCGGQAGIPTLKQVELFMKDHSG